ncbi:YciI family protein [Candidatus Solirubrobacter pratensis]|uniref:YciI family protein n=1 Tax=Candidatus Solirubrobacter pratensis TaxID=1298857 RepID=UPI000410585A|nr:YciI family protein [Candidatus Solirubrobacter pratensis]
MRFMLFVYPGESDQGPTLERVQAMNKYNEELSRAGALLALDGLLPPSQATRLTFKGGERPTVTDGPFTEAKEFVGGYWIIQARSKEEAVEWASRAPIGDGTIEVRQIGEGSDYSPEVAEARKLSQVPPEQTVAE